MGLAIILPVNPEQNLYNIITIGPGSPPPRPHPQPPLGIWGPSDPRPTLPIAGWNPGTGAWPDRPDGIWGPSDPRPTNPIAGFDPIHGTWPDRPPSGGGGASGALVYPMPVTDPPAVPPEGMPPDSKQYLIWFGPGTMPAQAWVAPYVSTGPVPPA